MNFNYERNVISFSPYIYIYAILRVNYITTTIYGKNMRVGKGRVAFFLGGRKYYGVNPSFPSKP